MEAKRKVFTPYIVGHSLCSLDIMLSESILEESLSFSKHCSASECDVLIVHGHISPKMVPYIEESYSDLKRPKYVIAFGDCAIEGNLFETKPLREIIPVTLSVSGKRPHAVALKKALEELHSLNVDNIDISGNAHAY